MSAKRTSVSMISTVTNQGKVRFMIDMETMSAQVLLTFLKQLIKGPERKIFLVFNTLRVHHAKLVKEWVGQHRQAIELFYLPSYSPELNPDEYLNGYLKASGHSRTPSRGQKHLIKKVTHPTCLKTSYDKPAGNSMKRWRGSCRGRGMDYKIP